MIDPSCLGFFAGIYHGAQRQCRYLAWKGQQRGEAAALLIQGSRLQDDIHFPASRRPFIDNRRGKGPGHLRAQPAGVFAGLDCFVYVHTKHFRREGVFEMEENPATLRKPLNLPGEPPGQQLQLFRLRSGEGHRERGRSAFGEVNEAFRHPLLLFPEKGRDPLFAGGTLELYEKARPLFLIPPAYPLHPAEGREFLLDGQGRLQNKLGRIAARVFDGSVHEPGIQAGRIELLAFRSNQNKRQHPAEDNPESRQGPAEVVDGPHEIAQAMGGNPLLRPRPRPQSPLRRLRAAQMVKKDRKKDKHEEAGGGQGPDDRQGETSEAIDQERRGEQQGQKHCGRGCRRKKDRGAGQ